MLLHTIIDPMAVMEQSAPPVCEYRRLSPFCTCEWTGEGRLRRIISTDLSSYLDPGLQLGTEWEIENWELKIENL